MQRFRTLFTAAILLVCMSAQAQWQWLDNAGRHVFSDKPPPNDIPLKNIVKQPGKLAIAATPPASAAVDTAVNVGSAAAQDGGITLNETDKDLLARRKKAEAEADAKTKLDAERLAKIKAGDCERAKANQAMMDSGVRISVTNAKGEREIMDDAARASEKKRNRAVIDANCG